MWIEACGTVRCHVRKLPELQSESYHIQRNVCEATRDRHNGVLYQASAVERTSDMRGGRAGVSRTRLQVGQEYQ